MTGRTLLLFFLMGLSAGCARLPSTQPASTAGASPSLLRHAVDPVTGVESVAYGPSHATAAAGRETTGTVDLQVGGIYAFREGAGTREDALALMIVASSPSPTPLFGSARRLLLDIDGELYTQAAQDRSTLYSSTRSRRGVRETVVVPVSRSVLERLARARTVGGRLGLWLTFDLAPEARRGFRQLLEAIPHDADLGLSGTVLRRSAPAISS